MSWETRPWATTPNDAVLRATRGGRLLGKRVEITLDPRAWETDDRNDLVVEGTVMAVSADGPTLFLEERDRLDGGRYPLIDVLVVREVSDADAR